MSSAFMVRSYDDQMLTTVLNYMPIHTGLARDHFGYIGSIELKDENTFQLLYENTENKISH